MQTSSGRLLPLLSSAQSGRHRPGTLLADGPDVSPRTVRRDIDRLRELDPDATDFLLCNNGINGHDRHVDGGLLATWQRRAGRPGHGRNGEREIGRRGRVRRQLDLADLGRALVRPAEAASLRTRCRPGSLDDAFDC